MKKLLLIMPFLLLALACWPFGTTSTSTSTTDSSAKPAIVAFTATPNSITAGQSTVLMWNVTNATSVQIDQGVGTGLAVAGTLTVTPTTTTTYKLTSSNSAGSQEASITVSVTTSSSSSPSTSAPAPGALRPNIVVFDISPNAINIPPGSGPHQATMRWEVRNAVNVTLNGASVPLTGTQILTPPLGVHNYILRAYNPQGEDSKTQVLHVNP